MNKFFVFTIILISFNLSARIGFKKFEIYKLKNNVFGFKFVDIDNDGRKDIAFVDNNDASVAVYYGQSDKEALKLKEEFYKSGDELDVNKLSFNFKFKNFPYVTEKTVVSFDLANISDKKLKDLIYLTSTGDLYIINQVRKRKFEEGQYFKIDDYLSSEYSLVAKDINGDGKDDIVLLGKKYLYVFYQNLKRKLNMPVKYSYSSKNPLGIEVNDVNGDGLNDIIFVTSGGINQIRVKFQLNDHTLGPDNIIEYPNFHFLTTKNILKNKKAQFISSRSRAHIIFIDELEKIKKRERVAPVIYSMNPEALSGNKNILFGDFDHDKKKDMVVSDPLLASIMFFKGKKENFDNFRELPAIKNISKLVAYKISGKDFIVGYSKNDASLFVYNFKKKIPDFIVTKEKIWGLTLYKNNIYVITDKDGKLFLKKIKITPKLKVLTLFTREISNFNDEFDDFLICDINKDDKEDIVFTLPYQGAEIFVSQGYSLYSLAVKIRNIKEFLKSITLKQIGISKLNRKDVLTISNKGIIRYFEYDKNKGLKIVYQFNGVNISSDLTLPVNTKVFTGKSNIVYFDKSNSKLYVFKKGNLIKEILVKGIDVSDLKSVNIDKDNDKELLIIGRNSLFVYDNKNFGYKLRNLITYRLSKENSVSTMMAIGNFDGKKLISIDGFEHSINFFKIKKSLLKSVLKFKIFDAVSYRGRENVKFEEPKEIYVSDMDGDGKDDVILYVHDKLLIYYQQ